MQRGVRVEKRAAGTTRYSAPSHGSVLQWQAHCSQEIAGGQLCNPPFDSDGRLLEERDKGHAHLVMEMLVAAIADNDRQVVDVRHKFARKRYAREYLWQPSPEIEAAISKEIFGRFETDKS